MYDYERFSRALATIDIPRSKFSRSYGNKTSFDNGQLIPIMLEPVLPGDTFNMKSCNAVVRLTSPLKTPIYDDIYCDIYFFFVPHRLVWKHWKNFMFENTNGKWIESTEYTIPQVTSPASTGWNSKTLADYLFIRPGIAGLSVNALRFRSYCLIYNEWFRDQNLIDPVYFDDGDSTVAGTNGTDEVNDTVKGSCVLRVSRFKDYMSAALPAPQKGPDVILPLGKDAPVYTGDEYNFDTWKKATNWDPASPGVWSPLKFGNPTAGSFTKFSGTVNSSTGSVGVNTSSAGTNQGTVIPINLYTDLSLATATTINALRSCFQLQKFYERLSIGGSRYTETIRAFFNVESSDARLQRPEFLAGDRFPVNINQVVQNTPNTDGKLGTVGAYSLTFMAGASFLKSFEEHGYIMGLICTRHHHTYQQGIDKDAFKTTFTDYYFPVFNNLGESPIYNREIFVQGTSADGEVFGYNESFADYRSPVNRLTGEFRSDYSQSLDTWHLADDYSTLPILSKDWIEEQPDTLDRVIQVSHSNANQFIADIHFDMEVSRCMSEYAVPGLIDHH